MRFGVKRTNAVFPIVLVLEVVSINLNLALKTTKLEETGLRDWRLDRSNFRSIRQEFPYSLNIQDSHRIEQSSFHPRQRVKQATMR